MQNPTKKIAFLLRSLKPF